MAKLQVKWFYRANTTELGSEQSGRVQLLLSHYATKKVVTVGKFKHCIIWLQQ